MNLAVVQFRAGDAEGADATLLKGLELNPGATEMRKLMGGFARTKRSITVFPFSALRAVAVSMLLFSKRPESRLGRSYGMTTATIITLLIALASAASAQNASDRETRAGRPSSAVDNE